MSAVNQLGISASLTSALTLRERGLVAAPLCSQATYVLG